MFLDVTYWLWQLEPCWSPTFNTSKQTNIPKKHMSSNNSHCSINIQSNFTYINPVKHLIISCFSFQYKSPKFFLYSSRMLIRWTSIKRWLALSKSKLDILKKKNKGVWPLKEEWEKRGKTRVVNLTIKWTIPITVVFL